MPYTHVCFAGIEDKLLISLVDGIISEVDEVILEIFLLSLLVILCGKTSQSLLVDVDADWIAAVNEDVYPHIELQAIN